MKLLKGFFVKCDLRKTLLWSLAIIVLTLTVIQLGIPILEDFLIIDKQVPHVEALVVMAGSMPERLPAAARLFQEGISRKILLTNDGILGAWSEEKQRNLYRVEWAEFCLTKMQVPEEAVVKLAYSSSGSIYDAMNSRTEILDKGIKSIIIVTSDYHTRRSLWCFERVLRDHPVTIGVYPAKSEVSTSSDCKKFLELCREMIKYVYYIYSYRNIE
ncbi:MAG: hypothetical protein VR65_02385 [Desulfobulbaceae bacterium BRH_c16a]|nr:MAG: hypothetical protein VR65_02385 [Desulfobulbaceae bacterium BRH_c16a]